MLLTGLTSKTNTYAQFLTVLLLFVFVLLITWGTTRWIARIQKGQMAGGNNLEIIESARVAPDKYVEIVRAGDKYLVLGVGKGEVHMLTELTKDELNLEDNSLKNVSFSAVFDKIKQNKNEKNEENM